MKSRLFLLLVAVLAVVLTACSAKTRLRFDNPTKCGTATIRLTNTATGNRIERTVDEGEEIEIEIDHGVLYEYEVEFAGYPEEHITCDKRTAAVKVDQRGKTVTITLDAKSSEKLRDATDTPDEE